MEPKTVIIYIISLIFLTLAFMVRRSYKNDLLEMENYKRTYAVIDRVIFSDTGNAKYYVSFEENGRAITAQTDHYSSETKSLDPGDRVEIGYFFTRAGTPRAVIFDERLIPVSTSVPGFYKALAVMGVLFFVIASVLLVKSISA